MSGRDTEGDIGAQAGAAATAVDPQADGRMVMTVTAALLGSGRVAATVAHLAALLASLTLICAPAPLPVLVRIACTGTLVLWPLAAWFALRVELDARLFATLAPDLVALARFDATLVRLGLHAAPAPRDVAKRCAGALRLWQRLIGCAALQLALLGVALASLR